MLGILGDGDHVVERAGAFFRNHVVQLDLVATFVGTGLGLLQVAGVADRDADVAVGQVADVLGGVEVGDRRTDLEEQLLGGLQVFFLGAVGRLAQVVQRGWQHFGRRVEEAHAAALELGEALGVEHHIPRVDLVHAQRSLDLLRVVADADRTPHVGEGIFVARVAGIANSLEQVFVEVFPVGQLGAVQLLIDTGLDLLGQEVVGRHDDVITRLAGQKLGLQGLVAVEDVVLDLDAGLFFELLHGVRSNVVRPVVDVQHLVLGLHSGRHGTHEGGGQQRLAHFLHA
ncbi:hypothetical protein D3C79_625090 [compost metagenome]